MRLLLYTAALIIAASATAIAARAKFVYDYTCPRCHRVETYEDALPQERHCTGDANKQHPRQKMTAVKRDVSPTAGK